MCCITSVQYRLVWHSDGPPITTKRMSPLQGSALLIPATLSPSLLLPALLLTSFFFYPSLPTSLSFCLALHKQCGNKIGKILNKNENTRWLVVIKCDLRECEGLLSLVSQYGTSHTVGVGWTFIAWNQSSLQVKPDSSIRVPFWFFILSWFLLD